MDDKAPGNFLNRLRAVFILLTGTMAVLSPTLIRAELIPEQINFVAIIGTICILVALAVTLKYNQKLRKLSGIWLGIALLMLVVVILLQVRYVVTLENFGDPPATYKYLIGCKLTDEGNRAREVLGRNKSESEFVAEMGVDRIPVAYGTSYFVVATIYSIGYSLLVFATVLFLGSVIIPE
jgi:hypothetical protein